MSRVVRYVLILVVLGALGSAYATAYVSYSSAFFESAERVRAAEETTDLNSQNLTLPQAARNIDPQPARGGGTVLVADGTALAVGMSPFKVDGGDHIATSDQISLYQVQEGDTLSQVAQMFNVSVSTIVWANDLRSGKDIRPGMTLLILPVSGVQHTVTKGDTLQSIAKRYGGDTEEIIAFNDLSSDGTLVVGSVVTIPGGEVSEPKQKVATRTGTDKASPASTGGGGYFIHPIPNSVRTQGIHGYNGIDFGAPAGSPVRAAAAGTVIVSRSGGWNGGYGNYVVIDHPNGTQTLYAHFTSNAVAQGENVERGQVVGYVGNTGRSTGNHLHFEVRGAKNPF